MTIKQPTNIRFAFFGTSHIAAHVLDALEENGFLPQLVVTPSSKPQGRSKEIVPCAVEVWATARAIPVRHDHEIGNDWDVCVVADYGRILPQALLNIPRHGFLNVHPSLLPRLRGASPMRTAILTDEKNTGVTIILLDDKMDHGPIVAQKQIDISPWPPHLADMERTLMRAGGALLAQILPAWIAGDIEVRPQMHDLATFCGKLTKEDGLLDLAAPAYDNLLKIRALEGWPGAYAFFERNGARIRVQILDATIESNSLKILRVKPEGKQEMSYDDFLRGGAKPVKN